MSTIAFKLLVYDENSTWLGEVTGISSLQWLEEYADVGDVKLVCAANDENRNILKVGARLLNTERTHITCVIDTVDYSDSTTTQLTIRAKFSATVWEKRVMTERYFPTTTNAELAMLTLVNNCKRGINCQTASAKGFANTAKIVYKQDSVLSALKSIAQASGLGFCHSAGANLQQTFTVYSGVDRTNINTADYKGYFAVSAGNVKALEITQSNEIFYNYAIVQSGDKDDMRTVHVNLSAGGDVYEILEQASDIRRAYNIENADGTITRGEYTDAQIDAFLHERGLEVLYSQTKTFTVKASLQQVGILFGKDYDVGDILPLVVNYPQKICVSARVLSVKIIYEESKEIELTLEVSL